MIESEIRERAEKERDNITRILTESGMSENRLRILEPIIINTAWMKIKLDDTRETIKTAQIAVSYDNGGGQKGIRENPLFKGYEALWKSYMQGMNRIIDCLPEESAKVEEGLAESPKTVLEIVRNRRKKEA